LVVLGSVV